METETFEEGS